MNPTLLTLPMVSANSDKTKIAGPSAALFHKALARLQVELYQTKNKFCVVLSCLVLPKGYLLQEESTF